MIAWAKVTNWWIFYLLGSKYLSPKLAKFWAHSSRPQLSLPWRKIAQNIFLPQLIKTATVLSLCNNNTLSYPIKRKQPSEWWKMKIFPLFPFIKQSIGCHQKVSLILAFLSSYPHERGIPMVGSTNEALSHLRTAGRRNYLEAICLHSPILIQCNGYTLISIEQARFRKYKIRNGRWTELISFAS